jgi:dephospho-CoA kinase
VLRVGLTGGIGSGKSAVASALVEHGAVLIDADVLAREVVEPGTPGLARVRAEFGDAIIAPDGSLDRPALGRLVFADPGRREALNRIVHPLVRARARELESAAATDSVVVHDIPLLVETGQAGSFDLVLVVDAPDEVRLERLVADRGMSPQDVRARISAQADRATRLAAADVVLDNSGSPAQLRAQVDRLWPRLAEAAG